MAGAPVDVLQRVALFEEMTRSEVEHIARVFKERRFRSGETVTKEGLGGAAFFLIESGEAIVTLGGEKRAELGPGDYFGEIALIDEGARSATITAASDLVCYGLTLWDFQPLVRGSGELGWKLAQALAKKLRAVESELTLVGSVDTNRAG